MDVILKTLRQYSFRTMLRRVFLAVLFVGGGTVARMIAGDGTIGDLGAALRDSVNWSLVWDHAWNAILVAFGVDALEFRAYLKGAAKGA